MLNIDNRILKISFICDYTEFQEFIKIYPRISLDVLNTKIIQRIDFINNIENPMVQRYLVCIDICFWLLANRNLLQPISINIKILLKEWSRVIPSIKWFITFL